MSTVGLLRLAVCGLFWLVSGVAIAQSAGPEPSLARLLRASPVTDDDGAFNELLSELERRPLAAVAERAFAAARAALDRVRALRAQRASSAVQAHQKQVVWAALLLADRLLARAEHEAARMRLEALATRAEAEAAEARTARVAAEAALAGVRGATP